MDADGDASLVPAPSRLHVLVAEDDPDVAELFRVWLWGSYNVAIARDGMDALRQARQYRPDVVLLDIVMPSLHGTTVAWVLRNDPRYDDVPIVLFTGRVPTDDAGEITDQNFGTWASAVADVRIGKPHKQADLEAAIARALVERPRRGRNDRRLVPRFDVLLDAELVTEDRTHAAQVLSLSLGGAFVECADAPPPGSHAALGFVLGERRFDLRCIILHEGQLRATPGVGVRFDALSLGQETQLIRGLAALLKKPAPEPR